MTWQVSVVVLFFLAMGVAALVSPTFIVGRFGLLADSSDAQNEVRAVYGGFGLAVACVLIVGETVRPELSVGIRAAIAASLFGMAGGRLIGAAIRRPGRWPLIFFAVELALGALLLESHLFSAS